MKLWSLALGLAGSLALGENFAGYDIDSPVPVTYTPDSDYAAKLDFGGKILLSEVDVTISIDHMDTLNAGVNGEICVWDTSEIPLKLACKDVEWVRIHVGLLQSGAGSVTADSTHSFSIDFVDEFPLVDGIILKTSHLVIGSLEDTIIKEINCAKMYKKAWTTDEHLSHFDWIDPEINGKMCIFDQTEEACTAGTVGSDCIGAGAVCDTDTSTCSSECATGWGIDHKTGICSALYDDVKCPGECWSVSDESCVPAFDKISVSCDPNLMKIEVSECLYKTKNSFFYYSGEPVQWSLKGSKSEDCKFDLVEGKDIDEEWTLQEAIDCGAAVVLEDGFIKISSTIVFDSEFHTQRGIKTGRDFEIPFECSFSDTFDISTYFDSIPSDEDTALMDIESDGSFNAEFTMKLFNSDGEEYSEGVEITAFKDIYVTVEHTGDEDMPSEWVYYLEKCTVFDKENPIDYQIDLIEKHTDTAGNVYSCPSEIDQIHVEMNPNDGMDDDRFDYITKVPLSFKYELFTFPQSQLDTQLLQCSVKIFNPKWDVFPAAFGWSAREWSGKCGTDEE